MQIDLTQKRVQALAKTLRRELGAGVNHRAMLDALAKGFGYKSYAALKSALPEQSNQNTASGTPSQESTPAAYPPERMWDQITRMLDGAPSKDPGHADIARIGYAVLPDGYAVQAYDADNQPIEDLTVREGNASGDGVTRVAPNAPSAQNPEWLFVQARRDALAMAERHGVSRERVFEDTDLEAEASVDADDASADTAQADDPFDGLQTFEVTFTPRPAALAVTVVIDAVDHDDFRRQLLQAEDRMTDVVNTAFDKVGDLRLSGAGDYGIHLQLAVRGVVVAVYKT